MNKILFLALLLAPGISFAFGFRTGQTTVTTGTAVVMGSSTSRIAITVTNTDSSNPIYCGDSTVTSSTGIKIPAGAAFSLDGAPDSFTNGPEARKDFYCVATGSSVTATWLEGVN